MDDFDSPPASLPDLAEDSDEDDNLLKVVFSSPKKENVNHFLWPNISKSTPAPYSPNLRSLSPSPAHLNPREEKELLEQRQATQRLIDDAQSDIHRCTKLKELDTKVHLLKKDGGIIGLAKRLQEGDEDSESSDSNATSVSHFHRDSEVSELDLKTAPPGLPYFTLPAQYLEELSPPYLPDCTSLNVLESSMLQGNASALNEAVEGGWLTIFFKSKPCPLVILEWLWEVACLSQAEKLRNSAFKCLSALLSKEHKFCRMTNISSVLAKLGVDFSSGSCPSAYNGSSVKNTQLLTDAVLKIVNLVNLPYLQGQQCFSQAETVELLVILLRLSLDPVVCVYVDTDISRCISRLVLSLGSQWRNVQLEAVYAVLDLTDNYHNQLHIIVHLLSSPDLSGFQRLLAKNCLIRVLNRKKPTTKSFLDWKQVNSKSSVNGATPELTEKLTSDLPDCEVALAVIDYFGEEPTEQVNYRELHSIMLILGVLVHHPRMRWSSPQLKVKFIRRLTYLSNVKIKNNIFLPDSGPVKDLLIRMKLEVESEGGGGLKQQSLFGIFAETST